MCKTMVECHFIQQVNLKTKMAVKLIIEKKKGTLLLSRVTV